MTEILEELARLGQTVPGGSQIVPNVFGTRLIDARAIITEPSRQLALGFVLDSNGAGIDPIASVNSDLIVLNQSPAADSRVAINTSVNLIVSAAASTSPQPQPRPTITQLETPTGTVHDMGVYVSENVGSENICHPIFSAWPILPLRRSFPISRTA